MQEPILATTGFSPLAADYAEKRLDILDLLSPRPESTYFLQISDDAMCGAGVFRGDLVIVDQALNVRHNSILVAITNNSFVVRRLCNQIELYAENPQYPVIKTNFQIFGLVTFVFRCLQPILIPNISTPQIVKHSAEFCNILNPQPESTFVLKMRGDAMVGAGIWDQDLIIVDRALKAEHNTIIVAILNQQFVVRRLMQINNTVELHAENPWYQNMRITPGLHFQIWGIVRSVVRVLQPNL